MSTKSCTKTRFSANDAARVLIDDQSGIMQLVHDYSPAEFRNNMFFPDRIQGYREARRVLKPGGHFFFNVWDQISESEFAHVIAQALAADVVINLVEVKKENWSYGNGDA